MLRHIWESSQRLSSRVWHWYSPSAHAIWGTVIRGRQRFDRSGIRCRADKNSLLIQHGISDRPGIRGSAEHSWSALNNDSSVTGTLEVKLFDVCSSPVFFFPAYPPLSLQFAFSATQLPSHCPSFICFPSSSSFPLLHLYFHTPF